MKKKPLVPDDPPPRIRSRLLLSAGEPVSVPARRPKPPGLGPILKKPGAMAYMVRLIPHGRESLIDMARLSVNPKVIEVVRIWDENRARGKQREFRIEPMLRKAGIRPSDFIGEVAKVAHEHNVDLGRFMAALAHPQVVKKTIAIAMKDEGHRERRILLEHEGFVTTPGVQTTIWNQPQVINSPPGTPPARRLLSMEESNIRDVESQNGGNNAV